MSAKPWSAEQRIAELGITLPSPPQPLGAYVTTVITGDLLFLSGMLPIVAGVPQYVGRVGVELDLEQGRAAAHGACLNVLATAKARLGSLDRVVRIVKLGVAIATSSDFIEHAKLADSASNLLESVFGPERASVRLINGVVSLPMGLPVALELVFEIEP